MDDMEDIYLKKYIKYKNKYLKQYAGALKADKTNQLNNEKQKKIDNINIEINKINEEINTLLDKITQEDTKGSIYEDTEEAKKYRIQLNKLRQDLTALLLKKKTLEKPDTLPDKKKIDTKINMFSKPKETWEQSMKTKIMNSFKEKM